MLKKAPKHKGGMEHRFYALGFTSISEKTHYKKIFESVAKQHFQKFSWFGFGCKAL
jgi:hypothetical protein